MISLFCVLGTIALCIFLTCEHGTKIASQFAELSDERNRCDWYLLPIAIQRIYLVFLSDPQNPITIQSDANIISERETAMKVINSYR